MYVGYVTVYFPPELEGGQMTGKLFHVEYDDGGRGGTGLKWPLLLRSRLVVAFSQA